MGSRLEIKVEKIENPTIFWQPSRTYCLNMTKSEFFPLGIWWLGHILHKNPFSLYESGLFF
jgi:hypothetical protein